MSDRDPHFTPAMGDSFEAEFAEKMFPGVTDEQVTRLWTVRVFGVDGDSHVAVKLYGVGRFIWPMAVYRDRARRATFLQVEKAMLAVPPASEVHCG